MADKTIQSFINEERDRCASLVEALRYDPDLILYCINSAYTVDDIDAARKRYEELGNDPMPEPEAAPLAEEDEFADLM